jgi:starvation-inducible DNA-binding protein
LGKIYSKERNGAFMENIVKDLNDFLSDLNIFYRKLQNYHWNVRGKDFFVLHSKLEEYYDEVNKQIDEIAEHILMLGEQPLGTMQDYLNNTCIVEAKNEKIEEKAIFENIINDLGTLLNKVTNIKEEADKQNMYATSSLMDEYIEGYMKKLWMCRQRDKGDRS